MLVIILIAIILSFVSFHGEFYRWLEPRLGVGWSYVIDQSLPMMVALIFLWQRKLVRPIFKIFLQHKMQLSLLSIATIIAHGLILRYYFFAEDSLSILTPVTNNSPGFPFHYIINGYPFASFVLSYLLFQTQAWLYNIVSLGWFLFAVIGLYCLAFVISNKKNVALLASLYFATTPVFLDVFSWQANAQGMPLVLALHVLSFIFLYFYIQKRASIYYVLSFLFFIASVKLGFVRIAGLVFGIFAMLWLPARRKRSILLRAGESIGFGVVWLGYIGARLIPGGWRDRIRWDIYWDRLSYYMAQLVLPNSIGAFSSIRIWIGSLTLHPFLERYLVFGIGMTSIFVFIIIGLIALLRIKSRHWLPRLLVLSIVLILGSMVYVPLYITTKSDLLLFPFYFARITPPYGPGARYVFSAAVGVSILFGIGLHWLLHKDGMFRRVGWFMAIVLLVGNSIVSIQGHRLIIEGISNKERALIDNFFTMVPRDGKPKLVYSANPVRNALDANVGGWRWLFGFYRTDELFYSNDPQEIRRLIALGTYTKDRFFAFYSNPETSAFADISEIARKDFFRKDIALPIPVSFENTISKTEFTKTAASGIIYLAKRPMLISREIGERLLKPKALEFSLDRTPIADVPFPFSDALILSKETRLPGQFWWMIKENAPIATKNVHEFLSSLGLAAFQDRLLGEISFADRVGVNRMIQEIDDIQRGVQVTVTGLDSSDARVRASALTDGLFALDPAPAKDEAFYMADKSPAVMTLVLPYPVVLGRILLNTPKSMVGDRAPVEASVYASVRGGRFRPVGTLDYSTKNSWSPNNGSLYVVPVQQVLADTVQVVVSKTTGAPVVFDEIVVEPNTDLIYTPAQIFELAEKNWYYVGDAAVHASLDALRRYKDITLAWTCAEDNDWEKQKKNGKTLMPGVWNIQTVPLESDRETARTGIDCRGSVLRTIVIIGPPSPSRITISSARIL